MAVSPAIEVFQCEGADSCRRAQLKLGGRREEKLIARYSSIRLAGNGDKADFMRATDLYKCILTHRDFEIVRMEFGSVMQRRLSLHLRLQYQFCSIM